MATDLQRQLAVIAANSTHQLDLKAQRAAHGKSLLFDAKDAVSQDFDGLYQLCKEGFDELCALDDRFLPFSQTLFSEQSRSEERGQWTADQNKEFSGVVESFLDLAASRLMLKPAQKAVEWLVRRFRVHEYDTEALLIAFIPYHSTPIFQSLLTIIPPQKLTPAFQFIQPYLTNFSNPPLSTVIHAATYNNSFFALFNKTFMRTCNAGVQTSSQVSFWTSIMAQAIGGMLIAAQAGRTNVQEDNLQRALLKVLPVINDGLAVKGDPDVIIGCCLMMTVLAAKADLQDLVLDSMMEAVASAWSDATCDARLACLAVLSSERQVTKFSKSLIKRLQSLEEPADKILKTSDRCRADRLALGYVLGHLERMEKRSTGVEAQNISKLVRSGVFDDSKIIPVVRALFSTINVAASMGWRKQEDQVVFADLVSYLMQTPATRKACERAMKKSGLTMEGLEVALGSTVTVAGELAAPAPVVSSPAKKSKSSTALTEALDYVNKLPASHESFLAKKDTATYEPLSTAFALALESSDSQVTQVLDCPALSRDKYESTPAFFSFLVRLGCSHPNPAVRARALQVVGAELAGSRNTVSLTQVILPYLLCGLSDVSSAVRRASADGLRAVAKHDKHNDQDLSKSLRHHDAHIAFYGDRTQHLPDLSAAQMSILFKDLLVPGLQAYVLDQTVVTSQVEGALRDESQFATDLKSVLAESIAAHAIHTPLLQVLTKLSCLIPTEGRASAKARASILEFAQQHWMAQAFEAALEQAKLEGTTLSVIDSALLRLISSKDEKSVQLLQHIVSGKIAVERMDIQQAALDQTKAIWSSLQAEQRRALGLRLLRTTTIADNELVSIQTSEIALDTLRSLKLDTDILIQMLELLPQLDGLSILESPAAKRRKIGKEDSVKLPSDVDRATSSLLRQYSIVLELVESSQPASRSELLQPLFRALGEVHQLRTQTKSDLVYLQGLVIDCLLRIVDKAKDSVKPPADKNIIRADLVVDCVRNTSSPQVQRSALLLISCLAVWLPDVILHSVMPIFTFMGQNILRQGDDYSAHVIDQTISRVVPPLVASLKKKSRSVISGASELLTSFIAAFEHMPQSRRLVLFEHVTRTLGPEECLYAVIVMIVDRYPSDSRISKFTIDLLSKFDTSIVLTALNQYTALVTDLFKTRRQVSATVLHLKGRSEPEIAYTGRVLLDVLAGILEDRNLRARTRKSLDSNTAASQAQRDQFGRLVSGTIDLLESFRQMEELHTATARVLSNALRLLPVADLIQSCEGLLIQSEDNIRLVLLKALGAQITELKQPSGSTRVTITNFLTRLQEIIQSTDDVLLSHAAISVIDQVIEKVGKQETAKVAEILPLLTGRYTLCSTDTRIKIISCLTLATAVDAVKDEFIPVFPAVIDEIETIVSISIGEEKPSHQLFNAAFALINAILEHLPYIVGDHLATILGLALQASASGVATQTRDMRQQFYSLINTRVSLAEALVAMRKAYPTGANEGFVAMAELLKSLQAILLKQSNSSIRKNATIIFDILLDCLDLRRAVAADELEVEYDVEEVEQLENLVVDIVSSVTWALSDVTFRPSFVRLVDWASSSKSTAVNGKELRATTFFHLLKVLFGKLKAVLTSYMSYCIELSIDCLSSGSQGETQTKLTEVVLEALEQSFEHASEDYWQSPSNFTPLTSPLLALLSTSAIGKSLTSQAVSTITAYAAAGGTPDHHKAINAHLLKSMRHEDAVVRLRAVQCQASLTERLAEDWLSLLSEMLPVITELLEDDDELVERETRRWVKSVEGVLGESLDAMLQ